MIKYCLKQWDKNKSRLEAAIRADNTINNEERKYDYLVKLVVDYILNEEGSKEGDPDVWDSEKIYQIDDGEWSGTLLFLIPKKTYVPAEYEYLMTYADYGSCHGCDTLLQIQGYDNEGKLPTGQQVDDYMTLCRDLVSHMIVPYNFGWRHDKRFDSVEEIVEFGKRRVILTAVDKKIYKKMMAYLNCIAKEPGTFDVEMDELIALLRQKRNLYAGCETITQGCNVPEIAAKLIERLQDTKGYKPSGALVLLAGDVSLVDIAEAGDAVGQKLGDGAYVAVCYLEKTKSEAEAEILIVVI